MPISTLQEQDTIAAIATAPGRGGIGIIRLSGKNSLAIAEKLSGQKMRPRFAHFCRFLSQDELIDEGLAIYFSMPNSFTGEDVVELQIHGGPLVLRLLLEACLRLGARQALPGEFSQRAFLNDKLDLTQVEAIADLIDAGTTAGVRAANQSLQGVFSQQVNALQDQLNEIRIYVEAAIDFPEEEIDFIADSDILERIRKTSLAIEELLEEAQRGLLIREGARIAIIGRPNAGKSSLLNLLARQDVAIVSDIAGTTRDSIEQQIEVGGAPVTFIDTAGLNDKPDQIEKIGIDRALSKANDADILLFLFDASIHSGAPLKNILGDYTSILETDKPVLFVANKSDLPGSDLSTISLTNQKLVSVSAKTGEGLGGLLGEITHLLNLDEREPRFSARTRHVHALTQCKDAISSGLSAYDNHHSGELLAEDLRVAQNHLSQITGNLSADELLGKIFAGFCIGK
ncbi:MAG: tRNA uridine-5-carboxymethylaminomethyl(34) synthesis GTPase MnmE [Pseudomonadales bacterium]